MNLNLINIYQIWQLFEFKFFSFFKLKKEKNLNIYINFEKYNYSLIEFFFSFFKGEKFSILDFCTIIGITIPHYCYHPDLSIAGNCRMCLIQLDGSLKPIASCALLISSKMIINTQSVFVKKIQEVLWNFYL